MQVSFVDSLCLYWTGFEMNMRLSRFRSPSRRIPTFRHFWKRQNGHRFLWVLSILQSWLSAHVYRLLFCTVLLKKPFRKKGENNVTIRQEYKSTYTEYIL